MKTTAKKWEAFLAKPYTKPGKDGKPKPTDQVSQFVRLTVLERENGTQQLRRYIAGAEKTPAWYHWDDQNRDTAEEMGVLVDQTLAEYQAAPHFAWILPEDPFKKQRGVRK